MKPVRIFRHIACEPPGYLGDFLRARGVPFEVVCIDEGQTVPADLDGVSGLVFMGGAGSVHDSHSWIAEEIALIRRAVAEEMPVLGVCLGGQLMSVALGGEVTRAPAMEIGWHEVRQVPGAVARDWLAGAPERFTAYHWHAWTFSVPEGAERLLASDCTANQAFAPQEACRLEQVGPAAPRPAQLHLGLSHGRGQDGRALRKKVPGAPGAVHVAVPAEPLVQAALVVVK